MKYPKKYGIADILLWRLIRLVKPFKPLKRLTPERFVSMVREMVSILGGLAALVSVIGALFLRHIYGKCGMPKWSYLILICWTLIPPVWFFGEWVFLRRYVKKAEDLKTAQELARNIWVALVVVLAAILGISLVKPD